MYIFRCSCIYIYEHVYRTCPYARPYAPGPGTASECVSVIGALRWRVDVRLHEKKGR